MAYNASSVGRMVLYSKYTPIYRGTQGKLDTQRKYIIVYNGTCVGRQQGANMDQKAFGKRVMEKRKEMNMSQNDLAGKLGVTRQHLSLIEAGKGSPSIAVLAKISECLGQRTDWFIFGKGARDLENVLHSLQVDTDLDQVEKDAIHNIIVSIKNLKTDVINEKNKRRFFSK